MEIKININVCRVCLKPPVEPVSLFSDHHEATSGHAGGGGGAVAPASGNGANHGVLARQFTAVTQLEVSPVRE